MAKVKIEGLLDHLSDDMRRALQAALEDVAPDAKIDAGELFRAFHRQVGRQFHTWERVPDRYVGE